MLIFFILSYATCQYVTTIAGSGAQISIDGQGLNASFNLPQGLAVDLSGNLFVSEPFRMCIRKINATGFVSTFAGSGSYGYSDGQGTQALFYRPVGICVDSIGNLYIADSFNQRIRMINSTGYVTTIAGSGKIGSADGQSTFASFNYPNDVYADSSSKIYVADQQNNMVRMINSSGYVSTIAGNGSNSFVNGQGHIATFGYPSKITLDSFGTIYVSDSLNNAIRKINSTGYVSTFAGNGTSGFTDGLALSTSFSSPGGISIDTLGNLFVTDYWYNRIRMINTTGYISTVAGNGNKAFRDGFGLSAEFNFPFGIALDSFGNIFVADSDNNRIRKIDMNYTATELPSYTSLVSPLLSASVTTSVLSMTILTSITLLSAREPAITSVFQQLPSVRSLSQMSTHQSTSNYHQNSIFSSIYFKTGNKKTYIPQIEFTVSFFVGVFFGVAIFYLVLVIKKRRKSVEITPRFRFIQNERERERKMAELRKRTLSKVKTKRKTHL